jgi:hypothetical protein
MTSTTGDERLNSRGSRADGSQVAERVVAEEGFNVNRAGVVFVPVVEGRDLSLLALRLADTSRAVFAELLELDE